jgi:hypothetical protein
LALACQAEPTTPGALSTYDGESSAVVDDVVSKVLLAPDSQLVFAGSQLRVTATAVNRAGEALVRSFAWKSGNTAVVTTVGSSLPAMTFRAVKAGKTTVKATVDGKFRFSKVVVRATGGGKVVVTPAQAESDPGSVVPLVATGLTKNGEIAVVSVTWTADGGSVSPAGAFSADAPGTYRVIARAAFGAADTSLVTISGNADPITEVVLAPEAAELEPGASVQFETYGLTDSGDSVGVPASYAAEGGTITAGGRYTAGTAPGTYQVTATSAAGLADLAEVTITAATVGSVVLVPGIAASRPDETIRFSAVALSPQGVPLPDPVTFETTCGTVTSAGVYRAPTGEPGPCRVTAAAGDAATTTEVVILSSDGGQGIPFGINDLWSTATTTRSNAAPLTGSREYFPASEMARHIDAARARGIRLMLVMTGGSHDRYKTNGVFDQAKWEAAMDVFDRSDVRDAIAAGVADGTITGNSVMDEPQQSGTTSKDWGPPGTMTKARVDQLCAYVKSIFPTLPVGVGHDHNAFEPTQSYQVCEFYMPQYAARKGNVSSWRDAALAMAARDGMSVVFSMNLLDGGVQDKTGPYDCAGTGGIGTHGSNCRMTPDQIRDWGTVLGPAGCAFLSWRYESDFMAKPENQAAFSEVAILLAGMPRRSCGASRAASLSR